jgi:hypothetical protein
MIGKPIYDYSSIKKSISKKLVWFNLYLNKNAVPIIEQNLKK